MEDNTPQRRGYDPSRRIRYIFGNIFSLLAPVYITVLILIAIPQSFLNTDTLIAITFMSIYLFLHYLFMKIQAKIFQLSQQWFNVSDENIIQIKIIYNVIGMLFLCILFSLINF